MARTWRTRAPVDLAVAAAWTVAASSASMLEAPLGLRIVLGAPLVLFLPGYAVLGVTHPGTGADEAGRKSVRSLHGKDRLVLASVLSIAVVVVLGLVLVFLPVGLAATPAILGLAGFTLVVLGLAAAARMVDTPPERRPVFQVALASGPRPWYEWLSLFALVGSLVGLAVAAVGFNDDVTDDGYVALYLEPNLRIPCYPLIYAGGNYSYNQTGGTLCHVPVSNLTVFVDNHEQDAVSYDVVFAWSARPDPEATDGNVPITIRSGRLAPLADGSDALAHQLALPLPLEAPPFEGLQYLKVQLHLHGTGAPPDHALQLRVVAA
ncbi:MAG: hypothetical protein QOJ26_874 [Thermoplasmata archaeon]|jgi:hypothetical protein|nr:hypothetical protein [Thermoplasmata archaeon]